MMTTWFHLLLVAAGGAAGSVARYLVARISASWLGTAFPYGTLLVNIAGSLLLGFVAGLAMGRVVMPETVRLLVGVGFCGGFTTFSTFAVDTLTSSSIPIAVLNVALNNLAALGAAALGLYVGMRL